MMKAMATAFFIVVLICVDFRADAASSTAFVQTTMPAAATRLRRTIVPVREQRPPSLSVGIESVLRRGKGDASRPTDASRIALPPSPSSALRADPNDGEGDDAAFLQRFLSPQIDDPGLPLIDAAVAQVVGPTLQICWTLLAGAPSPSWIRPIGLFASMPELAPRGSLLAPTLIHGAGLAVCWIAGALAARMYERENFMLSQPPSEGDKGGGGVDRDDLGVWSTIGRYGPVFRGLVKAGAFSTGILIVSTQLDLLSEFGGYVQVGESEDTDFRLLVAAVELLNDVVFEALAISSWRVIHAQFMSNPENSSKRF